MTEAKMGGSWVTGHNLIRPVKDINAEIAALEGELDDQQAKATLAEFLYANPAFLFDIIGGFQMYPMQELVLKGWARNDYNLAVWGRGASKSFSAALFALYWAIFNPKVRIVIASYSFRQAREILHQCVKFINDQKAGLLRACFPNDMKKGTDEYRLEVPNGALIRCLPLGDGKKIRGIRADLLIVDEFAFLPETIIGEILRPFLSANSKIQEQMTQRRKEDRLIEQGLMSEADRVIIEDRKKVIFLSSACYQFEHLYRRYCNWVEMLTKPEKEKEFREGGVSYFVSRISYEACPAGLVNMKDIEQAKREISEAMFNREYNAMFTPDSEGYFRAAKMQACTIPNGEAPCLELVGDPKAEYIIGIDGSLSNSETSDYFALIVAKMIRRASDDMPIPLIVHSYAVAGGNLKDHMLYFHWLLTHFNVVYIGIDASQGNEVEFVNSCNQSKLFQDSKIKLSDIDAEFNKDDFGGVAEQIKRSYNRTEGRIVQKQGFGGAFQRAANEHLQACFDHRRILFAAKIAPNSGSLSSALNVDISTLQKHEEYKDMSPSEFIEHQDHLVDVTKAECAMIQQKQNPAGGLSFDLPQNMKRATGANRPRKDLYSAILLLNWCFKLYQQAMTLEVQTGPPEFPYGFVA